MLHTICFIQLHNDNKSSAPKKEFDQNKIIAYACNPFLVLNHVFVNSMATTMHCFPTLVRLERKFPLCKRYIVLN